jgi:phosphoribosylformylglycinamidine synthase
VHSAHDIAEGGLAVALAECAIAGELGAEVTLPDGLDPFAEAPGQAFVVSGPAEILERAAAANGELVRIIGRVSGTRLEIEDQLDLAVSELHDVWQRGLARFV